MIAVVEEAAAAVIDVNVEEGGEVVDEATRTLMEAMSRMIANLTFKATSKKNNAIFLVLCVIFIISHHRRGPRGPRKDGGGRFNTGSASADAREAEKDPSALAGDADVTPDEGVDGEGPATEDAPAVEETPAEPVVPEETYEQYMAKRNEARANADLFGARNDTRVVDNTIIPGKVKTEVKPEDVNSFIIGQEKVKAAKKSEQRSTTSKAQVVEVAFQVEASAPPADDYADRGGRGRGRGRGEGRGGGGRGGSGRSSPRSSGPRVDISSDELFPSL